MGQNAYATRNETLKKIGFGSYAEYLRSDLWACVRERAFTMKGKACVRCGRKATSLHHADYKEPTLTGDDVSGLLPVCGRCHEMAERGPDGAKTTIEQATAFLRTPWRARCGPKPGTPISEVTKQARAKKRYEQAAARQQARERFHARHDHMRR